MNAVLSKAPTRTVMAVLTVFALFLAGLTMSASSAAAHGDSPVTLDDIELRDELVAAQEALLNAYRCLFDVDTQIVPGGCAGDVPALPALGPAPFTGQLSHAELDLRDALVRAQEDLLNVYRCKFDVDTEIVPWGCIDGVPASGPDVPEPGEPTAPTEPATPPEHISRIAFHFTKVVAASTRACGLLVDGTVHCWGGYGWPGMWSGTPGGIFTDIIKAGGARNSTGHDFCGLRPSGELECWGHNGNMPGGGVFPNPVSWAPGEANDIDLNVYHYDTIRFAADNDRFRCAIRIDDSTIECTRHLEITPEKESRHPPGTYDNTYIPPDGEFVDMAVSTAAICGLRTDGTVICNTWFDWEGFYADPFPGDTFISLFGAGSAMCGIRIDYTIRCVTDSVGAQVGLDQPPSGEFQFVDSYSSVDFCGLRTNGEPVCWGQQAALLSPAPEGSFVSIAVGWDAACAVRTTGELICWGSRQELLDPVGNALPSQSDTT